MVIIRQIRCRLGEGFVTTTQIDLNLPLEVRLVDDRDSHRAIQVLKGSYFEVFSRALRINTDRSWACEAEITGKGPKATGYFESVAAKADEDGIAASGVAGVILSAPPVQISGCVAENKSLVPKLIVSMPSLRCARIATHM